MNEHSFIQGIHRALKRKSIYVWKVNASFQAGVPDAYYSGVAGDLWVEYKYGAAHSLSKLQDLWLTDRSKEGRNCWLVWGVSPDCLAVITNPPYPKKLRAIDRDLFINRNEFIDKLVCHCCGGCHG